MPSKVCVRSLFFAGLVYGIVGSAAGGIAQPIKTGTSLMFADLRSSQRFTEYREILEADRERFRTQLDTIRQLEQSDVQYVIAVVGQFGDGVEGKLTTDGERVVLYVSDATGSYSQHASLVSRFAHELEHARQFDSGELALMYNAKTKTWSSHYGTYDIGDEVKAWSAQLAVATPQDFFVQRRGQWHPTLLRLFASAGTDEGRAQVLMQNGYSNVNPVFGCNVRFATSSGHYAGEVLRPDTEQRKYLFARVFAIGPNHDQVAGID